MSTENKSKIEQATLLSTKELAEKILGVSKRTVHRLNCTGKIPAPLRIGGSLRWHSEEISLWIGSGCPDRHLWEELKMQNGYGQGW